MLLAWLQLNEEKVSSMTPDSLEKESLATQLQEAQVGHQSTTAKSSANFALILSYRIHILVSVRGYFIFIHDFRQTFPDVYNDEIIVRRIHNAVVYF